MFDTKCRKFAQTHAENPTLWGSMLWQYWPGSSRSLTSTNRILISSSRRSRLLPSVVPKQNQHSFPQQEVVHNDGGYVLAVSNGDEVTASNPFHLPPRIAQTHPGLSLVSNRRTCHRHRETPGQRGILPMGSPPCASRPEDGSTSSLATAPPPSLLIVASHLEGRGR